MKRHVRAILMFIGIAVLALPSHATIYLDDTWADGTRNNQALPSNSAWFASTGSQLTSATSSMSLSVGSGSIMAITYFTTNSTTPVRLSVGDTLVATFNM